MLIMGKYNGMNANNTPSIMEPIDMSCSSAVKMDDLNDAMTAEVVSDFKSLNIQGEDIDDYGGTQKFKSFLLLDSEEKLRVHSAEAFIEKLECKPETNIKVVSIFGNTGDGKSYTMNNTFFNGEEVFRTSSEQDSFTMGTWAALQPYAGVLCLDTEGLLGVTSDENQRTRMLLKVLAISDIIIYRTRAERLHKDMFSFLGTASKAFCLHFSAALQSLNLPGPPQSLGPAVIVFHETRNTNVLHSTVTVSPEDILRDRFAALKLDLEAFSSMKYIGITSKNLPTDFSKLKAALTLEIENKTVRSARQPSVVYQALKELNSKFSGNICERPVNPFPEQYFTCTAHCESCNERCERSMGHEGEDHKNSKRCRYQHQFENKVFLCKGCRNNGREVRVIVTITTQSSNDTSWLGLAKYAWSGSVIECPNCGEIYRSRQYWYGNKSPEDFAVVSEIVHVWKGSSFAARGQTYSAQMIIDGVSYLAETVSNLSAQPSKALTDWAADKIAPDYWVPNSEIIFCHACKINFDRMKLQRHHCRQCGRGFCNACSKNELPVPGRGWFDPVRVCNECKDYLLKNKDKSMVDANQSELTSSAGQNPIDDSNVRARKVGEAVISTLSSVAAVLEYPKDLIKDSVRPSYWISDAKAPNCKICNLVFGTTDELITTSSGNSTNSNGIISGHSSASTSTNSNINSNDKLKIPLNFDGDRRRHHCRACGSAVCNSCSSGRRPVPERGWPTNVRVCDACINLCE